MEEKMTVGQVIEATIRLLGEIQVPMALYDQIGTPIKYAINNLYACLNTEKPQEVKADGNADAE